MQFREFCFHVSHQKLQKLKHKTIFGRAMVQAVSRRPLTAAAWVRAQVNPVGFVVEKAALRQVFSEFFCVPLSISFHRGLHISEN
jgi:hypothetical protein